MKFLPIGSMALIRSFKDDLIKAYGTILGLVFLMMLFGLMVPGFLSSYNLMTIGVKAAVLTLLALGQTIVILNEGIDLSLGAVLSVSGVIIALLLHAGWGVAAVVIGVLIGAAFGMLTGLLISVARLTPFIASMGTMGIAQGISLALAKGGSVASFDEWFLKIAGGSLIGIPLPIWFALFFLGVTFCLFYGTKLGPYTVAIGGNEEATRLSGINIARVKTLVYVISGTFAGLGAVIMTSRLNAAHPIIGMGMEFDSIAAVIVGGSSFFKGNGGIFGTIVGVFLISILRSGMNLVGIDPFWQLPLVGITIILAIVLSTFLERRRTLAIGG